MARTRIGELVAKTRGKLGLTQDEFGAVLGVNGQTVSNLETGGSRSIQKLESVRRLAKAADLPVDEVIDLNRAAAKELVSSVTIELPKALYDRVVPVAAANNMTAEAWVALAVENYMRPVSKRQAAMKERGA